jgi:hypothetical protein
VSQLYYRVYYTEFYTGEETYLNISIQVNGAWRGNIGIEFHNSQGTYPAVLVLKMNIVLLTPHLVASPSTLKQNVVRGGQGFATFSVRNTGSAPAHVTQTLNIIV